MEHPPVLRAALETFAEVGYHAATVRAIAGRAGLSVPGMYHHHATKQDLLVEIMLFGLTDLLERSQAAQAEAAGDPVRTFSLLIECLVLYHIHRRDSSFVGASETRSLEPQNLAKVVALRVELQRMVDDAVDRAVAVGRFRSPYPHEAARAAVTACTSIPRWYQPGGAYTPDEIAVRYVHLSLALVEHQPRRRR